MKNNVILITGATDGLGKAVAQKFSSAPVQLIVHGRSEQRCLDAIKEIRSTGIVEARIDYCVADFMRLGDVFRMIRSIRQRYDGLDLLINNAGIGIEPERAVSHDGYEAVLQVNYLATYALSIGLFELLSRARGRIVCISSLDQALLDFEDPNYEDDWNPIVAYSRSKWAQVAFTCGIANKMARGNVTIHSLHPGSLMPTKLVVGKFPILDTIEKGVESVWSLAHHREPLNINGCFINNEAVSVALDSAYSSEVQLRLLDLSASMISLVPGSNIVSDWKEIDKEMIDIGARSL